MDDLKQLLKTIRCVSRNNPVTQLQLSEMCRVLYTDKYKLYLEKVNAVTRKSNSINENVDFAQALGQDHLLAGNQSTALGIGHKTTSYRELLFGSYAIEKAGTYDSWIETDRLIGIGNGLDEDNRHDALNIYKSGYSQLNNALRLGAFSWGANIPEAGALQYTAVDGFRAYKNSIWNKLAFLNSDVEDQKLTYFDSLTGNLKTSAITKSVLENHLSDVSTYSAKSVNTAAGQILSAFTSDAKGHVTGISLRSLVAVDIPSLEISKITGLQTALDGKSPTHTHPYLSDSDSRIAQWNTAYNWGNHAGLYRPVSWVPTFSEITSKPTTLAGYGITDAVQLNPASAQSGNINISGTVTAGNTGVFVGDYIYRNVSNDKFTIYGSSNGEGASWIKIFGDWNQEKQNQIELGTAGIVALTLDKNHSATFASSVTATQLNASRTDGGTALYVRGGDLGSGSVIADFRDYNNDVRLRLLGNGQLQSAVATGTAPLTVNSTTMVANLNAERWGGHKLITEETITSPAYIMTFDTQDGVWRFGNKSTVNSFLGTVTGTLTSGYIPVATGSGSLGNSYINQTEAYINVNATSRFITGSDGGIFVSGKITGSSNFIYNGALELGATSTHATISAFNRPSFSNFDLIFETTSNFKFYANNAYRATINENGLLLNNLSGTGTRIVTASSSGQLGESIIFQSGTTITVNGDFGANTYSEQRVDCSQFTKPSDLQNNQGFYFGVVGNNQNYPNSYGAIIGRSNVNNNYGYSFELFKGYGSGGASYTGDDDLWYRSAITGDLWRPFVRLWHSGNSNLSTVDWAAKNVTATSFIKYGGTSSQFLKADGSVDGNSYSLASHNHNGVYSYYHQPAYNGEFADLHTVKSSGFVTFDEMAPANAPGSAWYNGFISTHGDYLSSYILNAHRTQDWFVGCSDAVNSSGIEWAKLWHSNNLQFSGSGSATTMARSDHNHSGVYQPIDANLTAIAALAGTSGLLKKTAADTWSLDTNTYATQSWVNTNFSSYNAWVPYCNGVSGGQGVGNWGSMNFQAGAGISLSLSNLSLTISATAANNYPTALAFSGGYLNLSRSGLTDLSVSLDGRYSLLAHTHDYSSVYAAKAYEGKVRTASTASVAYLNGSDFLYNSATDTIIILKTDYAQSGNGMCMTSGGVYTALAAKAALAGSTSQEFSASRINLPGGAYATSDANGVIHLYPGSGAKIVVHGEVESSSFYKNT